jgi:meiotically up-regulated gene 157 (Mug157) protein
MLSVELKHLADVLDKVGGLRNVSQQAKEWSTRIHGAIWKTTVSCDIERPSPLLTGGAQVVNNIFAYETNGKLPSSRENKLFNFMWAGLGSRYVMDDANVPVNCKTTAFGML